MNQPITSHATDLELVAEVVRVLDRHTLDPDHAARICSRAARVFAGEPPQAPPTPDESVDFLTLLSEGQTR